MICLFVDGRVLFVAVSVLLLTQREPLFGPLVGRSCSFNSDLRGCASLHEPVDSSRTVWAAHSRANPAECAVFLFFKVTCSAAGQQEKLDSIRNPLRNKLGANLTHCKAFKLGK